MRHANAFSGQQLRNAIDVFLSQYPKLAEPDHALNRCKFYSQALTGFLRERGFPAHCYHVQHIRDRKFYPDAHGFWKEKPAPQWTHYVVRVGNLIVDITSRQLDPKGDHPLILRYAELQDIWKTAERDHFVTKVAKELHTRQGA